MSRRSRSNAAAALRGIGIGRGDRITIYMPTMAEAVILMLAAVIYLVWSLKETTGITSFAFADLVKSRLPLDVQSVLLAAFALSFAIKVPMAPLHTWLPDAHVEAPTGGSVVLAAIMLKLGGYGFLRFSLPILPAATRSFVPMIAVRELSRAGRRLRVERRQVASVHGQDDVGAGLGDLVHGQRLDRRRGAG